MSEKEPRQEQVDAEEAEFTTLAPVESNELILGSYDPHHVDISAHRLAMRVYSFGKGNYIVTDIDAKGIKTIALRCGISVTSSKYKETSDGNGYYFTAKAKNLVTGQTAVDHCFQLKTLAFNKGHLKKGDFDEDALAKGATRVVRRVRRQLIPEEIIDQAIEYAMIGKTTGDAVGTAKKDAEEARNRVKLKLREMGINARICYDDAQAQMGPAENWGAAEWYALRDKYLDPETEFAHLVQKQESKPKQASKPEPTDYERATKDVMASMSEFKAKRPDLISIVFTEDGKLKRSLLKRWFNKESTEMDVADLGQLVQNIGRLVDGDYTLLPKEMQPATRVPRPATREVQPEQTAQATPEPPAATAPGPQQLNYAINLAANTPEFTERGISPQRITEVFLAVYGAKDISQIMPEGIEALLFAIQGEDALQQFLNMEHVAPEKNDY